MSPKLDPRLPVDPGRWHYPVVLFVAIAGAVVLHLNYWMWDVDRIVMSLPANLFYHVLLSLALAGFMLGIVRMCWPPFLDDEDGE